MDYKQKYEKYKRKYLELRRNNQVGGKNKPQYSRKCINTCLTSHSQHGENYVWLNVLGNGPIVKIEFEEPVGSGNWRLYTDKWWETHCIAVDHRPGSLAEAHIKAFVNPKTRFARKRFTFENGLITEPTNQFYELEDEYFSKYGYCANEKINDNGYEK